MLKTYTYTRGSLLYNILCHAVYLYMNLINNVYSCMLNPYMYACKYIQRDIIFEPNLHSKRGQCHRMVENPSMTSHPCVRSPRDARRGHSSKTPRGGLPHQWSGQQAPKWNRKCPHCLGRIPARKTKQDLSEPCYSYNHAHILIEFSRNTGHRNPRIKFVVDMMSLRAAMMRKRVSNAWPT